MRFNLLARAPARTTNLAVGRAYALTPEAELALHALTSFVTDQFYRSQADGIKRLLTLLDQVDPRYAAQVAVFARREFGMRSVSHVIAGELAQRVKGADWTKHFFNRIVLRPDDMLEIAAYCWGGTERKGRGLPKAVRNGFGTALAGMDAYRLGKYRAERAGLSLVDLVNLVHPPATEALGALVRGELRAEDTWELELTRAGQAAESPEQLAALKAAAWERLLTERKLGYFALLRNLRNIVLQAPEALPLALAQLREPEAIRRSLVLPFRFLTALKEFEHRDGPEARSVVAALSDAVELALGNIPPLPGRSVVVLDVSGSMHGTRKGGASYLEIGSLFAAALAKAQGADVLCFNDRAWAFRYNPRDAALSIARTLCQAQPGGTNFGAIFGQLRSAYDRIFILSDMQGWVGGGAPDKPFADYRKRTGADPLVYSIDLAGYGTLQFPQRSVYALAGFSEKLFELLPLLEENPAALVARIRAVEL